MRKWLTVCVVFVCSCIHHISCGYLTNVDSVGGECEVINVEMCSRLGYNMTKMPNFLGHTSQEEASQELRPYSQLVNLHVFNCSRHININFFLCSLFFPMCTQHFDGPLVVKVCRSMCLKVKADCEPVLRNLNVPWPLNCSHLPESGSNNQLCMAPDIQDPKSVTPRTPRPGYITSANPNVHHPFAPSLQPAVRKPASPRYSYTQTCPAKYVKYSNATCTDLCNPLCTDCVPSCTDDVFFKKSDKDFVYIWIAIWSSLCIVSVISTMTTFCIEPRRFRYPTRPVIFMAFCYLMYSIAYVIRLVIPAEDIACKTDQVEGSLLIVRQGMHTTLCIVIFLLQYYFAVSSHVWWLILTLTWFLAASKKWGLEAINSIACYFHLFAWAVPAILTIAILVTGKVDANELTGMCYVGNDNKWSLFIYVIIPVCFLVLVGEIFLLAGFGALFRVRRDLSDDTDKLSIRKLEKLMAKIGMFAILYTIPVICTLGSHIYEGVNIDTWRCLSMTTTTTDNMAADHKPSVEIQLLKIFMSFLIGITISLWIISTKTIKSWKKKLHPGRNKRRAAHMTSSTLTDCSSSRLASRPTEYTSCVRSHKLSSVRQQYITSPNYMQHTMSSVHSNATCI